MCKHSASNSRLSREGIESGQNGVNRGLNKRSEKNTGMALPIKLWGPQKKVGEYKQWVACQRLEKSLHDGFYKNHYKKRITRHTKI